MAGDAEAVVRAVVDKAKSGDMTAARIVVDRLLPLRRGRPVQLSLPMINGAKDLLAAQGIVVEALAAGDVTAEEAATVSAVLETHRKIIETEELADRLQRLEEKMAGAPMSFASFDRRLRKLETVVGSDDPRRYLHLPLREWPDEAMMRALEMGEEKLAELMAESGEVGFKL